jgi:hypothetical protein
VGVRDGWRQWGGKSEDSRVSSLLAAVRSNTVQDYPVSRLKNKPTLDGLITGTEGRKSVV